MPFLRLVYLHACGFACMLIETSACLLAPQCACLLFRLYACVPAGRHTGRRADRCKDVQVCGYACTEMGRLTGLSVCKGKGISSNLYRFEVWWQLVAASGREWLRSPHVFNGLNALPLHPSGRTKPKARTASPGSVLLLGSGKVSGYRCLAGSVTTGLSPIRSPRIFVSSKTQQGMFRVTRNLAGYSRKPCP